MNGTVYQTRQKTLLKFINSKSPYGAPPETMWVTPRGSTVHRGVHQESFSAEKLNYYHFFLVVYFSCEGWEVLAPFVPVEVKPYTESELDTMIGTSTLYCTEYSMSTLDHHHWCACKVILIYKKIWHVTKTQVG